MKFTLPKSTLVDLLGRVSRVIEKRQTIAVLGHVHIHAEAGRITFAGSDMEIWVSASAEAVVEMPGTITAPTGTLTDIARRAADGDVAFELAQKSLTVKAGKSRFKVPTLDPAAWPKLDPMDGGIAFRVPGKQFARLFAKTAFAAMSSSDARTYLQGVNLHTLQTKDTDVQSGLLLVATATDGHKLACATMPAPREVVDMPAVIVPIKTVAELARLLGDGEADIEVNDQRIRVRVGSTEITSKLVDGTYPDCQRVIPTDHPLGMIADRADLTACIQRAQIAISERGRAVKAELDSERLTISAANIAVGAEASDEIRVDYDQTAITFGANGDYLVAVLGVMEGDTVEIRLDSPRSPIFLRDPASPTERFVVMPMDL